MSRPPLKAIEQIQRWCENHMCDKCTFGYFVNYGSGYTAYECYLNELAPYQWTQCDFQKRKDHKPFENGGLE